MRDAKSLEIIERLVQSGATVRAYDPIAIDKTKELIPESESVQYCENAYETAKGADAVVLVTEWNEFKFLNLERLKETMAGTVLYDGRNLYDPVRMKRLGFDYHCIGRSPLATLNRQ